MTTGLFERMIAPMAALPGDDDFWFKAAAMGETTAGIDINADNALHVSAYFAGVRVISEDLASLPLPVYERTRTELGESRERARDHPLYPLLHDQPNEWQSSFEWREMSGFHVLNRGNAYSHTPFDPRTGAFREIVPLNPARMIVRQLPSGRLRYEYRRPDGEELRYSQAEVLHVRGPSIDGIVGLSIPGVARNSLGLTVAAEEYGARSFANDPHLSGILSHPDVLSADASKRIAGSFRDSRSGLTNAWTPAVLEEGMTWTSVGVTSKDAEFLGTRKYQLRETARWLRIKPHKIGDLEDATYSNIEQESIDHVQDTIRPWAVRWEQALMRWGFSREERKRWFVEHVLAGLLRGDTESRFKAYQIAILTGWMDRNEVRRLENLNPREGLDLLLAPMNMAPASGIGSSPQAQQLMVGPAGLMLTSGADDRSRPIVEGVAETVVRREIAAVTRAARQHTDARAEFLAAVAEFYEDHYQHITRALQLRPREAQSYVDRQQTAVIDHGIQVTEQWEAERVPELVTLAIGAAA